MQEPGAGQQAELAREIRSGNKSAESDLVCTFSPAVAAMLQARTRDSSSVPDLVQDVMISVILAVRRGDVREPEKLAAFIRGVARNVANTWVRDQIKRSREDPLEENLVIYAAVDPLDTGERDRLVGEALAQLNAIDREILLKTLVEGEKPGAIANRLRLAADVVRQRKSRAVKKVAEYVRNAVTNRL